jgi:signal transduction histidine kinase
MELRLALRSSRQHLAEADDAKKLQNEFVAVISHELRTPLTAIRGSIGLIEAGTAGPVDDKVRELAAIANRNAANLLELVNELLEYQKMEAGLMEFAFAEVDPITLVESTVADMAAASLLKSRSVGRFRSWVVTPNGFASFSTISFRMPSNFRQRTRL